MTREEEIAALLAAQIKDRLAPFARLGSDAQLDRVRAVIRRKAEGRQWTPIDEVAAAQAEAEVQALAQFLPRHLRAKLPHSIQRKGRVTRKTARAVRLLRAVAPVWVREGRPSREDVLALVPEHDRTVVEHVIEEGTTQLHKRGLPYTQTRAWDAWDRSASRHPVLQALRDARRYGRKGKANDQK